MMLSRVFCVVLAFILSIYAQELTDDGCYYEYLNTRVMCLEPWEVCKNVKNCKECTAICSQFAGICQSVVYRQSTQECMLYKTVVRPTYGRRKRASGCYGNLPPMVIKNNPDFTYYIVSNRSTCISLPGITPTVGQSITTTLALQSQSSDTTSQFELTTTFVNSSSLTQEITATNSHQQEQTTTKFNNPPMSQETTTLIPSSSQPPETTVFSTSPDGSTVFINSSQPQETTSFVSQSTDTDSSVPQESTVPVNSPLVQVNTTTEPLSLLQQTTTFANVPIQQETTTKSSPEQSPQANNPQHPHESSSSSSQTQEMSEGTSIFSSSPLLQVVTDFTGSFETNQSSTILPPLSVDQNSSSYFNPEQITVVANSQQQQQATTLVEIPTQPQDSLSTTDSNQEHQTSNLFTILSQNQDISTFTNEAHPQTTTEQSQETFQQNGVVLNSSEPPETAVHFNSTDFNETNSFIPDNDTTFFNSSELNETITVVMTVTLNETFSNLLESNDTDPVVILIRPTEMPAFANLPSVQQTDAPLQPQSEPQQTTTHELQPELITVDINGLQTLPPAPPCVSPMCL